MTQLTRDNVDAILDGNRLQMKHTANNGFGPVKWRNLRRGGKTRTWKTQPKRLIIPVKHGLRGSFHITEDDFRPDGTMLDTYRAAPG